MLNTHEWSVNIGSVLSSLSVSSTVSFAHLCAILYLWIQSVVLLESLSLLNSDILYVYFRILYVIYFCSKTNRCTQEKLYSRTTNIGRGRKKSFFSRAHQFLVNSFLAHLPTIPFPCKAGFYHTWKACLQYWTLLHLTQFPLSPAGKASLAPCSSSPCDRSAWAPKSFLTGVEVWSQSPHL